MPPPTTTHNYPQPPTDSQNISTTIHHHPPQSKIYSSKKVFYKTNNKIFYSKVNDEKHFKVGFSPSKKICFICFIESPLKMMKNAFYFTLKALFVFKIFKFLSWLFGHVEKTA